MFSTFQKVQKMSERITNNYVLVFPESTTNVRDKDQTTTFPTFSKSTKNAFLTRFTKKGSIRYFKDQANDYKRPGFPGSRPAVLPASQA